MRISCFFPWFVIACLPGCAGSVRTMDVSRVPSFTVATVNSTSKETLGQIMTTGPKAFVLLLKKGDKVPIHLQAAFGPIALEPGENYLVFSRDTYLYVGPAGILLSPDGRRWAPVQSGAALGTVFDVKHGTFQVGFGAPAAFSLVLERK